MLIPIDDEERACVEEVLRTASSNVLSVPTVRLDKAVVRRLCAIILKGTEIGYYNCEGTWCSGLRPLDAPEGD